MADAFDAVASPARRALLDELRAGPAKAGALGLGLGISREAVSRHLRLMADAGLVTAEVQGRERIYRLTPTALGAVDDWLTPYRSFWTQHLDALATEVARGSRLDDADRPSSASQHARHRRGA